MTYEYYCIVCGLIVERQFPFAKNPKCIMCKCGKKAERYLGGNMTFILKGSGWSGKTIALNREMNKRQERAGERMEGTWRSSVPKLVEQF